MRSEARCCSNTPHTLIIMLSDARTTIMNLGFLKEKTMTITMNRNLNSVPSGLDDDGYIPSICRLRTHKQQKISLLLSLL